MSWWKWPAEEVVEPKVITKVVNEKCDVDAVCAYEYRGNLYRSKDALEKVKNQERKQEEASRVTRLVDKLTITVERQAGYHMYHTSQPISHLHRDAIRHLLNNYEAVGELLREAKGIPKIKNVSESGYKVVDE